MPHRHLDDELSRLRKLLIEMSELVDEQLADALDALLRCDVEKALRVRGRDDEVDALELEVDRQCERILALHTPVAVDLRLLVTAIKLNTDLERIGDHAKNLAKNAPHLVDCSELVRRTELGEMVNLSRKALHEAHSAFVERDSTRARNVLAQDKEIDRLYKQNLTKVVALLREHPDQAEALAHLITMSKAVERIADHAKNIAEMVVFLIEGVDIRHSKLQPSQD